jgi:signal transduction histidine kinase
LLNLYSNALKFTSRGGKITIVVEKLKGDINRESENLRVVVCDNGLGIKKKD